MIRNNFFFQNEKGGALKERNGESWSLCLHAFEGWKQVIGTYCNFDSFYLRCKHEKERRNERNKKSTAGSPRLM